MIIFTIIEITAKRLNSQLIYMGHSLFLLSSFIRKNISIPSIIIVNNKYLYGFISPVKQFIVGIIDIMLKIRVVKVIVLYFDSCFSMFIFLYINDNISNPIK